MVTYLSYCHPNSFLIFNPQRQKSISSEEALTLLNKCCDFKRLKQIHARIIRNDLYRDELLIRKIISLCSSFNQMQYANVTFHQLQDPSTFSYNLMIRSHTLNRNPHLALLFYNLMLSRGIPPDKFTFPFAIKACVLSLDVNKGKEVHGLAVKSGFSKDVFVQNTLIDLYLKCGVLDYGRKLFDKMRGRTVVTWTTLVSGLVACGEIDEARGFFERMGSSRNVVSWTSMIDGYVRSGRPDEAFELFWRMLVENVRPNEFTLVSLLRASTELGSLELGRWVHEFATKNGFRVGDFIGTALIDMYSKCDSLEDARLVFDKMEAKTIATWNAMITSLGVHGYGEDALDIFAELEENRHLRPDAVTFVAVLSACVNTNNVNEGYRCFRRMTQDYGIEPIQEHYACMMELYRRAEMFDAIRDLEEQLLVKQDKDADASLCRESEANDITDIEKFADSNASELHNHGELTLGSSEYQPWNYKWDVG